VFGREDEFALHQSGTEEGLVSPGLRRLHDSNGVDRSLIRSNLQRSPTECLQALEELMQLGEIACRVDESVR